MKEYSLADNLYRLRKSRGISQKEIAAYLGIKQAAYSKYETGETEPKIPTLIKLAKYYETDLNNLIGFSPLSPFEKAVKHLKYAIPGATVRKDNDIEKIFVTVSNKKFKASQFILKTEKDFIDCVFLADKLAIEQLQEVYNDQFYTYFGVYALIRQLRNLTQESNNFADVNLVNDIEKEKKRVMEFIKKKNLPVGQEVDYKRKTRSDKKKDGEN